MIKIFISYSRSERNYVSKIAAHLIEEGYDVWWDTKLLGGDDFDQVIEEQIDACDCIIVIWSKKSIKSKYVKAEASEGWNRNILVPVFFEKVTVPLKYRSLQTITLTDVSNIVTTEEYKNLLLSINKVTNSNSQCYSKKTSNKNNMNNKLTGYHSESIKIYNRLISDRKNLRGLSIFTIGATSISINANDNVGRYIEEWFGSWAKEKGFNIHSGGRSQFPDYYIGNNKSYLEIKVFNSSASANFDIANFDQYCHSIARNPELVDTDYLILSYKLDDQSILSIDNIWLKRIWEITSPSERWPLRVQTKRDVIYNIRPTSWYSDRSRFKTFLSKEMFIDAVFKTQAEYTGSDDKNLYLSNLNRTYS